MSFPLAEASPPYRYWAFISYSRHDARVAGLLVERLANAVVPKVRRSTVAASPARFAPVFLDTREAAASRCLDDELQRRLRESAKLVVLCSPFAVSSDYVSDEIRYFQSIGRDADILCLIVSGVPDAAERGSAALECFPDPLRASLAGSEARQQRPLAPALLQETPAQWRHAVEQLVAGLLDVSLEQRRAWASRRRAIRTAWAAGLIASASVSAYGAAWAWWLPQQKFAKQAVRHWGALVPIDEVSASMAARRPTTLLFERAGALSPWAEVRAIDGMGMCMGDALESIVGETFKPTCTRSKACAVHMTYAEGRIATEQVLDQYGQVLETLTYSNAQSALLSEAVVGCSRRPGDIEFVQIERHTDGPLAGLDRMLRFGGGEDKSPRPNAIQAFGWHIEYDGRGRVVARQILDKQGLPYIGKLGYSAIRYRYNDAGDIVEETMLGLNGQPVQGRDGYASVRNEVDTWGRLLVMRTFDVTGRPTADQHGVSAQQFRWDDRGRNTERTNLTADGALAIDHQGVALLRTEFNSDGSKRWISTFDAKNNAVAAGDDGCAQLESHEPPGLFWAERRCFDGSGRPAFAKGGWHIERTEYGPKGQDVADSYFDVTGKPTLCTDKERLCPAHRVVSTFDDRGNNISSRAFDTNGAPSVDSRGISRIDNVYNARNRLRREIFFGADDLPARNSDGDLAVERSYDTYGRVIELRSVDPEGGPVTLGSPAVSVRYQFDDLGNMVRGEHVDINGHKVVDAGHDGYASWRVRFDQRARPIERQFFDASDQPSPDNEGWFGYTVEYDPWGRETKVMRLGPDGQPQPGSDGVLERRFVYDARGHLVHMTLQGRGGVAAIDATGNSQWVWTVDERGNRTSERRIGLAGQPVADREGLAGYDVRFDARGRQTEFVRVGLDGRAAAAKSDGIARNVFELDERGLIVRETSFDEADRPQMDAEGVYGYASQFNLRGQKIESRRLAANGRPMADKDGVARVEFDYDAAGGVVETRRFDNEGRPTDPRTSVGAIVRYRNDPNGRELERSFYDANGRPVVSPRSGRWRVVLERDDYGRVVSEQSWGADGRPVNRRDEGWWRRSLHYGDMGQLVKVECFDTANRPVVHCAQKE